MTSSLNSRVTCTATEAGKMAGVTVEMESLMLLAGPAMETQNSVVFDL